MPKKQFYRNQAETIIKKLQLEKDVNIFLYTLINFGNTTGISNYWGE